MTDQPTGNRPTDGTFVMFRCRDCPWESPWVDVRDRPVHAPDYGHALATGHTKFWQLALTCQESTVL
jgi:hypothetical protein